MTSDDRLENLVWSLERELVSANIAAQEYCNLMYEYPGYGDFAVSYWQWVGRRKALTETLGLIKNIFGGNLESQPSIQT